MTKNNENFIEWKQPGYLDSDCRAWKDNKVSGALTTNGKSKILTSKNKRLKELVDKTEFGKDVLALDCYNQLTHKECMQTIKANIDFNNMTMVYVDYRIRKLTPRECFRLMGVRDEDFDKVAVNQSNASLYHLAGDSIVVNVLMAIFKNLL